MRTCATNCSRHGECDAQGVCLCDNGWTGEACDRLADWVIACLCILSLLVCCTGAGVSR